MIARFIPAVVALAAIGACNAPRKAERLDLDLIVVAAQPALRTSPIGGVPDAGELRARKKLGEPPAVGDAGAAITASYVLVDAENRATKDAHVTLSGTLLGADQSAPLRPESLFVPAGGTRTFLLLDKGLAARPWATGVKVVVVGAVVALHPPAVAITDVNQLADGDRVVLAANVAIDAKRPGTVIVHAAFRDRAGMPVSRAHSVLYLLPGASQTVRFVGPAGSAGGEIFAGDSVF